MRWHFLIATVCLACNSIAQAADGRVIKVMPQFLDLKGQYTISPSLYDRDAYQKFLRLHPDKQSGVRYAVQWKAQAPQTELKLRAQLRGVSNGKLPKEITLEEKPGKSGSFSHWTDVKLTGDAFHEFGEVTAWRVTLWDGDQLLGEQKSFLW